MLGECVFSLIGLLLCSGSSQVVFCWSGGTYVNVPVVSVMLFASVSSWIRLCGQSLSE